MRITGGRLGSRRLSAPSGDATRPTSDRVREALFSVLAGRGVLQGARVLDAFAGTGALGLESLSRGAAYVAFVERDAKAIACLRTNVAELSVSDCCKVHACTVEIFLKQADKPYSLIFADPPYSLVRSESFAKLWSNLTDNLSLGGTAVLEHDTRDPSPNSPHATLVSSRSYGDTTIAIYVAQPSEAAS